MSYEFLTAREANERLAEMGSALAAAQARIERLEGMILNLHGKALPPNWAYSDAETTVDLAIAECNTLRHEREAAQARIAELEAERNNLRRELNEANAYCLQVVEERRLARCAEEIARLRADELEAENARLRAALEGALAILNGFVGDAEAEFALFDETTNEVSLSLTREELALIRQGIAAIAAAKEV